MKHSLIRLLVVTASIGLLGCATTQSQAQTQTPATTPATTPVTTTPAPVQKTVYKGAEGVRDLLHGLQDKAVPQGVVEINATAEEILTGSLDSLEDRSMYEGPAKALMMAMDAGAKMPGDLKPAIAATITTTYNSWVVVCSGISQQRIPEWTLSVMTRVAKGDEAGANEATKLQLSSEQRVERLVNPGWIDSFAWWWSR